MKILYSIGRALLSGVSDMIISPQAASFACPRTDLNAGRSWTVYAGADAPAVSVDKPKQATKTVKSPGDGSCIFIPKTFCVHYEVHVLVPV